MNKKYKILDLESRANIDSIDLNASYTLMDSISKQKKNFSKNIYVEIYPEDYTETQLENLKKEMQSVLNKKYKITDFSTPNKRINNINPETSYSFIEALSLVLKMRETNPRVQIFPQEYTIPRIDEDQAFSIALEKSQMEILQVILPNRKQEEIKQMKFINNQ